MAYQTFGPTWLPPIMAPVGGANLLIDASGEMAAFILNAPATGSITGIEFMTNTVTTGDTLLISLQDVDPATGDPDGTADQSVTQVVNSADDNTKFAVTFGSSRSVTIGDLFAVVFEYNSYVAGNMNIRAVVNATGAYVPTMKNVYTDLKTGGTWAKNSANAPVLSLNYGGTYYPIHGVMPPTNTSVAYNSGSTPDEYALRYNSPVPIKVRGIGVCADIDGNADLVLYDSDGTTVLASGSLDPDVRGSNITSISYVMFADVTLAANTTYRVSLKPTSGTNVTLQYTDATSAAILAQMGCGTTCYLSSRVDAGSWTDVTTQRPLIFLLASQFDDGAGGSGGVLIPGGMVGGFRG